jgi:hypothetical protein
MPNLVARMMSLRRGPRDWPRKRFGSAFVAVNVGGVEKSDAEIEGLRDDAAGGLQIGTAAEIVAA